MSQPTHISLTSFVCINIFKFSIVIHQNIYTAIRCFTFILDDSIFFTKGKSRNLQKTEKRKLARTIRKSAFSRTAGYSCSTYIITEWCAFNSFTHLKTLYRHDLKALQRIYLFKVRFPSLLIHYIEQRNKEKLPFFRQWQCVLPASYTSILWTCF